MGTMNFGGVTVPDGLPSGNYLCISQSTYATGRLMASDNHATGQPFKTIPWESFGWVKAGVMDDGHVVLVKP